MQLSKFQIAIFEHTFDHLKTNNSIRFSIIMGKKVFA